MKKTALRKVISMVLLFAMALPMTLSAAAIENDPYQDVRTAIYVQLKAQNALHMYDEFEALLIPSTNDGIQVASSSAQAASSWYAPKGGVLHFKRDFTYQMEYGYTDHCITFMTPQQTTQYFSNQFGTLGSLILTVAGLIPKGVGLVFTGIGLSQLALDVNAKYTVEKAGGYGRLAAIYDSISGGTPVVMTGWTEHPTVSVGFSDAYDIEFTAGK